MSQYALTTLDSRARALDLRYQQTLADINAALRSASPLPRKVPLSRWIRLWKAHQKAA